MGSGNVGFGHKGTFEKDYGDVKTVKQKQISQEAVDKIVYDILSSDQGLAALATSENASGGFGSSTKTLMAQDLVAKITGEIGKITAKDVTNERTDRGKNKQEFSESAATVICTHLALNGHVPLADYARGFYYHDYVLAPQTYQGYKVWAVHVVSLMKKYPWLLQLMRKVVQSRYNMILGKSKFEILGALTIYVGEPICYLIGSTLQLVNKIWQPAQK
jgi:hypothetical protein